VDLTLRKTTYLTDKQDWLGSEHGTSATRSITLDTSAFTAGTHYPNGYFPSGLPLGKITATGLYGPYNDANSDGTQTLAGFLFTDVVPGSPTTVDVQGALFEHGKVIEAKLPVAIDAAGRVDVAGKIILI
jgi:hypothetical protein